MLEQYNIIVINVNNMHDVIMMIIHEFQLLKRVSRVADMLIVGVYTYVLTGTPGN